MKQKLWPKFLAVFTGIALATTIGVTLSVVNKKDTIQVAKPNTKDISYNEEKKTSN